VPENERVLNVGGLAAGTDSHEARSQRKFWREYSSFAKQSEPDQRVSHRANLPDERLGQLVEREGVH